MEANVGEKTVDVKDPHFVDLDVDQSLTELSGNEFFASNQSQRHLFCGPVLAHCENVVAWKNEILWRTSLRHPIVSLSCNTSETIIVAATTVGTVSLLRASDGEILVTRAVSTPKSDEEDDDDYAPLLAWISDDKLLVQCLQPMADSTRFLLVSNLDGISLTSTCDWVEAAKRLQMDSILVDLDVSSIAGFVDSNMVRFVMCTSNGMLWTGCYRDGTVAQDVVALPETDCFVDSRVGMVAHTVHDKLFYAMVVYTERTASIGWFDPIGGSFVCWFPIPNEQSRPRVLSMTALSKDSPSRIAFGVELCGEVRIRVVQLLADDTMGLVVLSQPHMLCNIEMEKDVQSVFLAPESSTSLRCKVISSSKIHYKELKMPQYSLVAEIRLLLAKGQFDAVEDLLVARGVPNETFSDFGLAEVAKKRLYASENPVHDFRQVQQCLERLRGDVPSMLQAVDHILQSWSKPTLHDTLALIRVIDLVLDQDDAAVVERKKQLKDSLVALGFLASLVESTNLALVEPFHHVRSPAQLFQLLVQQELFGLAEALWRSDCKIYLTPRVLVKSVLKLNGSIDPKKYAALLKEIVIPSLSIGHELLRPIRSWACRLADSMDDEGGIGLEHAVDLLSIVDAGLNLLELRVHASFARSSPFVEHREPPKPNRNVRNSNSSDSGYSDFDCSEEKKSWDLEFPLPTILQLDAFYRGPTRVTFGALTGVDQKYDGQDECVAEKLNEALCLQAAREAGLASDTVNLRGFSENGGITFVAKKLVSIEGYIDEGLRHHILSRVRTFCDRFGVDFDQTLLDCIVELCTEKMATKRAVGIASVIAGCSVSDIKKAQGSLIVLQAALLHGFTSDQLSQLSNDALLWAASDSSLLSEVRESTRLLMISGIVQEYCGSGAKDMFRVDNPRHALRLMDFVTEHVRKATVLIDAFSLCRAFTHLSPERSVWSLMRNAVMGGESHLCGHLLCSIIDHDADLVFVGIDAAMRITEELLDEISSGLPHVSLLATAEQKNRAATACECAREVVAVARQHVSFRSERKKFVFQFLSLNKMQHLENDLLRLRQLQADYDIWLSFRDLSNTRLHVQIISDLLARASDALLAGDVSGSNVLVVKARRACCLLSTKPFVDQVWSNACSHTCMSLVCRRGVQLIVDFLDMTGIFDITVRKARSLLPVAVALCSEVSLGVEGVDYATRCIVIAMSLLQDSCLISPGKDLPLVLSFAGLVETAYEILLRADEGVGEALETERIALMRRASRQFESQGRDASEVETRLARPRRSLAVLHRGWFIGDGILLPPRDAVSQCASFCEKSLRGIDHFIQVYDFLGQSGAHFLSLRVLAISVSQLFCNTIWRQGESPFNDYDQIVCALRESAVSLAIRHLGGSSRTGKTSGVIDSELAVAFLLLIGRKDAFAAYQASLPTAIKSYDFDRVFTLACVGIAASSQQDDEASEGFSLVAWQGQSPFREQCERLAHKSTWWHFLRLNGVSFDLQRFDLDNSSSVQTGGRGSSSGPVVGPAAGYLLSLLSQVILRLSKSRSHSEVLQLCVRLASVWNLSRDSVVENHVEWLLLAKVEEVCDLVSREVVLKSVLAMIEHPVQRAIVLRKCLTSIESEGVLGPDYARYSLTLSCYRDALICVLDGDRVAQNLARDAFEGELDIIDRRCDALAILSSYCMGKFTSARPDFTKLFLPLTKSFGSSPVVAASFAPHVLGSHQDSNLFDPLLPLEPLLLKVIDGSAATALASICLSLGLPKGFIHARALILKFRHATQAGSLPAFEHEVLLVVNRLLSAKDRVDLSEWCTAQYPGDSDEKLKCLDLALEAAMAVSSEIENRRNPRPGHDKFTESAEQVALERVRRITMERESLSDVLRVRAILKAVDLDQIAMASVVNSLLSSIDDWTKNSATRTPEGLMECLLTSASLVAAERSLGVKESFSVNQLQRLSSVVHDTVRSIAEQHSHIQLESHCKRLADTWLFHGDSFDTSSLIAVVSKSSTDKAVEDPEANTAEFVLNLAGLKEDDAAWVPPGGSSLGGHPSPRLASEEEPSCIKGLSDREVSDFGSHRASIRIAFVLACGFEPSSHDVLGDLNNSSPTVRVPSKRQTSLQSRKDSKRNDRLTEYARDLLRVVFAKSESVATLFPNESILSVVSEGDATQASSQALKVVTFAMRHRALRAASILCPQEVLENVVARQGMLMNRYDSTRCTLRDCSFGVFLAKEIEEMGLTLPHSDISQLSAMHFPSYARTLWRDHRTTVRTGQFGRFLLLVLEMSLKGGSSDGAFVDTCLEQMCSMNLPRTLLLAMEALSMSSPRSLQSLDSALSLVYSTVMIELKQLTESNATDEMERLAVVDSVSRLGRAMCELMASSDNVKAMLRQFETHIAEIAAATDHASLKLGLDSAVTSWRRRLCTSEFGIKAATLDQSRGSSVIEILHGLEASVI